MELKNTILTLKKFQGSIPSKSILKDGTIAQRIVDYSDPEQVDETSLINAASHSTHCTLMHIEPMTSDFVDQHINRCATGKPERNSATLK
ncbi:hypothetical protein ACTXT7_006977 [Hymenolepis weldensis]